MVNSQLIELLQHFTPEALHELQLFVASPYFNRGLFSREAAPVLGFAILAFSIAIFDLPQRRGVRAG